MIDRPDILVLGGGGRQGDAWMTGVLAGLEDAHGFDLRECDYFVGTSAGAIVATKLASGRSLKRPSDRGGDDLAYDDTASEPGGAASESADQASGGQSPLPEWTLDAAMTVAALFARLGLGLGKVPGEFLRGAALRAVPRSASETLDFREAFPPDRTRFDGRLRLVAVERDSGRRVVFGAPGAPEATVAEALTTSCALPLIFPSARVGGREYVDGAIWSPTNADVAPATRDAHVLILSPMASRHGPFHPGMRALSRAAMLLEASALKARGAQVRLVTPNPPSAAAMGGHLMSPKDSDVTLAAAYAQGLNL